MSQTQGSPIDNFMGSIGMGHFNFQSGFGSVNDAADSIGSLFGFGPEDRESVLSRATADMVPIIEAIINTFNNRGINAALSEINSTIASKERKRANFRSSNSKAGMTRGIELLEELKVALQRTPNEPMVIPTNQQAPILPAAGLTSEPTTTKNAGINIALAVILALMFGSQIKKMIK